jgi:putative transcriptional regulator
MTDRKDKPSPKAKPASLGAELVRGLEGFRDALREGEPIHRRFTMRTVELDLEPRQYGSEDVRAVREKLGASQAVFAKLLGVSVKTVQAWEQGNAPPPMARRLLDVIDRDPRPWEGMLRDAAKARKKAS